MFTAKQDGFGRRWWEVLFVSDTQIRVNQLEHRNRDRVTPISST